MHITYLVKKNCIDKCNSAERYLITKYLRLNYTYSNFSCATFYIGRDLFYIGRDSCATFYIGRDLFLHSLVLLRPYILLSKR
jgi:hypothetical protein